MSIRNFINLIESAFEDAQPVHTVMVKGKRVFIDGQEVGEINGGRYRDKHGKITPTSGYYLRLKNGKTLWRRDSHYGLKGEFSYAADLVKHIKFHTQEVLDELAVQEAWDDEVEYGAGEPVTADDAPQYFYHGTNPVAAALILAQNRLDADNPVDDDDLGAVVCVTSEERIAAMFAHEFERINSPWDVGVVFALDAKKVVSDIETVPYNAETASEDEFEFRVKGGLRPLSKYLLGVKIVGEAELLDDPDFLHKMFRHGRGFWARLFANDFEAFEAAIEELLKAARG